MKRVVLGVLLLASLLACGTQGVTPQNNGNGNNGNNGGGDTTAPTLTSSNPINGASSIAINSKFKLVFSEKMDTASVTVVADPNSDLGDPTWNAAGTTLSLNPPVNLEVSSAYTLTINGKDVAGNALAETAVQFTTAGDSNPPPPADTTAPTIVSSSPDDGATNAAINSNILITFSEAMNPGSVNVSTSPNVNLGAAAFKTGNNTVEFNPPSDLAGNTNYTVTVGGKDVAGNDLTGSSSFSFKTASIADTTAPGIVQNVVAEAGDSQIKFTWSANTESDLKGYTIYYSNNASNLSNSVFVAKPNTSKTLTGLTNGEIYFYQLEAEDGAGNKSGRTITKNATPKDATAPRLLSSDPANGAVNVPASSKVIFNFSEPMDTKTSKPIRPTCVFASPGDFDNICSILDTAQWSNNDKTLTLTYLASLGLGNKGERNFIFETASDKSGNLLPLTKIKFTVADNVKPQLRSFYPTNALTGVAPSTSIRLTFNEGMDRSSVESRFKAAYPSTFVSGQFFWELNDTVMYFKPNTEWTNGAQISWLLTPGVKDKAGNVMDGDYSNYFNVISNSTVVVLPSFGNGHIVASCDRGQTACTLTPYLNETVLRVGDRASNGAEYSRIFLSFPIYQIPVGARITQAQLTMSYAGGSGLAFQRLGNLVLERINIVQIVEQGYKLPISAFNLNATPALGCVGCPFIVPNAQVDLNVVTAVTADRSEGHALTQFRLRFASNSSFDNINDYIDFAKNAKLTVAYEYP
jgi:methionine-rich copper-binding protein CopC